MADLNELVPNQQTIYHVMRCGQYRMHNGDIFGGMLVSDAERALLQRDYKFIDCFPSFGGECRMTLEYDANSNTWVDVESE